ncbi:MAG: AsmA family protein, partial [Deltaproteobacteria bacterium]|nr:AsmA family protein [Deltaproteobacteria bacterium]
MSWKKIIVVVVLVVVVFLLAGYAFLAFYDFNKFKPMIVKAVEGATGRELRIGGEIDIRLGLVPTLVAEDVLFENAAWGSRPQAAAVKRMEIQIALLPMIKGHYEFGRIMLIEPDVIVETNGSGKTNFDFETSGEGGTPLPIFVFQDVRAEKGLFTFRDGKSGKAYSVRLERLHAVIPGLDQAVDLTFEGAFEEIPVAFEGTVGPIMAWIEAGHSFSVNATTRGSGVSVRVEGEIRDPTHLKDMAFEILAEGPSTRDAARLFGLSDVPDLGAFNLMAKMVDTEGVPALEDVDIHVGSEDLADISLSGGIKDVFSQRGIQF